jgi:hypothetical protein
MLLAAIAFPFPAVKLDVPGSRDEADEYVPSMAMTLADALPGWAGVFILKEGYVLACSCELSGASVAVTATLLAGLISLVVLTKRKPRQLETSKKVLVK